MARIARVVVPNLPHHVTQRGNRRQEVFFSEQDYRAYLALMRQWCGRYGLRVWAYCLMPNHVHLIVVPPSEDSLARAIGEAHRRYTRRVNFRQGWRGHLWQGRFALYVMDEPYLIAATRYIERNPVRAKLVEHPADWPFSSAAAHLDGRGNGWIDRHWLDERIAGWVCTWAEYLTEPDEPAMSQRLRRCENTGRPLADKPFIERVGRLLSRELLPKKPGPKPRKGN